MSVLVSVLVEVAGDGFTIVVLVSFFFRRRVRYGCFFLLTSRQKRGTNEEADVFVHVSRTDSDINYLRCWCRTLSRGASGRFGGSACRRGGRFSFLFASRQKGDARQDANVFLHNFKRFGQMMIAARTHFGCAIYKGS